MAALQAPQEQEVMETERKPSCSFMMPGTNMQLFYPEKGKIQFNFRAGLHYYMGLSRMTMASTLNFLTLDSPVFSWPLIDNSDQFARQLGMFAKGKYGKLEYRFSLNKPFATDLVPVNVTDPSKAVAVDNNGNPSFQKQGMLNISSLMKNPTHFLLKLDLTREQRKSSI